MRTLFLLSVNLLFTTVMILHAQDKMPQAVSYQAVARDAQGKVVAQKAIGIQVEILKGSTTGAVVSLKLILRRVVKPERLIS